MPKLQDPHLAVVRTANETLRASAVVGVERGFLCECGDLECIRTLPLTPAGYDDNRRLPDGRILHPYCAVREEREAVLAQNRLLRDTMRGKLEILRRGVGPLRGNDS